jgi:hypothetical protein
MAVGLVHLREAVALLPEPEGRPYVELLAKFA